MMQFFSMCMVVYQYTGISLIYLESVAESVNFYKKLGYHLEDERKSPEMYEEYQKISKIDLSNVSFPMLMRISNVEKNGYKAYSKNILPIEFES